MISFEEAYKIVIESGSPLGKEQVELINALDHVLAEDVTSDIDMPPFDKSAMDGYACLREDLANELNVIETIPAGTIPQKTIQSNECSKIMTGAIIPKGADCVVMVEHTEEIDVNKIRFLKDETKTHICYKGEDVKKGEVVLGKETLIKPQHIAVLASVGVTEPIVFKQPRVGIIITGNEIIEPSHVPALSQIRNSNGYQLVSQVKTTGITPKYYGIAKDTEESTFNFINQALSDNDVIILTGGVSMGDFDLVPDILRKLGVKLLFEAIAVKPGKPTVFGKKDDKLIFGLPGNPVSSFFQFELLVKPLLYTLMNLDYSPLIIKLPMASNYQRKNADRLAWIPVQVTDNSEVMPLEYHGSAHIHSLDKANGIIQIPMGKTLLNKGDFVDVRQI